MWRVLLLTINKNHHFLQMNWNQKSSKHNVAGRPLIFPNCNSFYFKIINYIYLMKNSVQEKTGGSQLWIPVK